MRTGAKNALRSVDVGRSGAHHVGVSTNPARTVLVAPARLRRPLVVIGPLAVLAIAAITANVSDARELANVALVLAAITVAVALVSAIAGVATSVVGALALNYFHTEPVHSLRMSEGPDVMAVLLLAGMGLAASAVTAWRLRDVARVRHTELAATARSGLHDSVGFRPVVDVWSDAVAACSAGLSLVQCRVATSADAQLPHIALHRSRVDEETFVLPATGAVVDVPDPRLATTLVLAPLPGAGPIEVDRRAVTAFVEQAGLALSLPVG